MGLIPTQWMLPEHAAEVEQGRKRGSVRALNPARISLTYGLYDGPRYVVRQLSYCLNRDGEWEYEPQPSSRDDAFIDRCRFRSLDEAAETLRKHGDYFAAEGEGVEQ